jgi:hypothetical protein
MAYIVASGIRFNDCIFTQPVAFADCTFPRCPGLYVILAEDRDWAPKAFQPLYFGEFGNNAPAAALLGEASHVARSVPGKPLYVAVLALPYSTTNQRWALCRELIRAYNPACQVAEPHAPAGLAHQLDARANEFFGAVPERRRRIGFLPDTTAAVAAP